MHDRISSPRPTTRTTNDARRVCRPLLGHASTTLAASKRELPPAPLDGGRMVLPLFDYWPLKIANAAPSRSAKTAKRPVPGMSLHPTRTFAPRSHALAASASTSSEPK
jgi:hypothetical protein